MLHPSEEMRENDKKLGFCQELFTEVKDKHTELAPFFDFVLNEEDRIVSATIKYDSRRIHTNSNWLEMARPVIRSFTDYLKEHPDHRLLTENWSIRLSFPAVTYRNEENGVITGEYFYDATYSPEFDLYTIPEFLEMAYLLGDIHCLHIESDETGLISNPEKTINDLKLIKNLKTLELKLPDVPESFLDMAKEAGIEVITK